LDYLTPSLLRWRKLDLRSRRWLDLLYSFSERYH
jgi:hypothetical protein